MYYAEQNCCRGSPSGRWHMLRAISSEEFCSGEYYVEAINWHKCTTGCPKVRVYFDTLLFSGLGGLITKSFDVLIAEGGWFFLRYNTPW